MAYKGEIGADSDTGETGKVFSKGVHEFKLGAQEVVEAWDQGVIGMCVGEIRVLTGKCSGAAVELWCLHSHHT